MFILIMKTCRCNNIEIFFSCENLKLSFAQNIGCRYTLEPPRRGGSNGGSNEYPQSMFWIKN